MNNAFAKNGLGLAAMVSVALGTGWAVRHFHRPGQLDVLSAQAMDMSAMRPPTGAAPVSLAPVRLGSLQDTVTYTGTIIAFNEQDISPRITGTLLALPVYPGDSVRAGQVVARLDTAEVGAKTDQAIEQARVAQAGADVAGLTHRLHHQAALDQASAQVGAAVQGVADARAEAQAAAGGVADARAAAQAAQAGADYWKTEIAREKQLADAGAASRQEYQSELSQAQAASASIAAGRAKVQQAQAMARAGDAKVQGARRQADAARAGLRLAQADVAISAGQTAQAQAGAAAARAAVREASVVQGYARLVAPQDGVVTARPVAPGTLVQAGTPVLRVAEIDRVRVQAHVAAADLAGIHAGSPVQVTPQGGAKPFAARVTSVFPAADSQTRTAVVEAVVPNPGHRLLPGASVTVRIARSGAIQGLLVPASSVVSQGGASYVWTAAGGGAAGAAQVYECRTCHMHYSAGQAKKNGYRDPMDGGRLVPVPGSAPSGGAALTAREVAVSAGASDGVWTEVKADSLGAGTRVVTHGQAGLTDGARVAAVAWGTDGPTALPTATAANQGMKLYKCEKCGMTYSEADARRDHFIDPMDGGRLLPTEGR